MSYLNKSVRRVRSPPIPKEDIPCVGGLVFAPIREIEYHDARREIEEYIEKVGGRRVYISELVEELQIDTDLIKQILNDIRHSFRCKTRNKESFK